MTIKTVLECDKCANQVRRAVALNLEGAAEITAAGELAASTAEEINPGERHYCAVCWKGSIQPQLKNLGIYLPAEPKGLREPPQADEEPPTCSR